MAETFGFFPGVPYGPEDFTGYFTDFYTNGIHAEDTSYFQVLENSGMTLTVKRGTAYVDGHFFKPPTDLTVTLEESDVEYPRIDLIVIRCDYISENVKLEVITGEPNAVPTIPEMERNAGAYDLGIAAITVNPNVSEVTQVDIKDLRFDVAYCGVVVGKIDTINTTNLFAQYNAEWDLLRAAIGQDEQAIIDAWKSLSTVKTINEIEPVEGNIVLTQADVPSGGGYYQMPYKVLSGTVTVTKDDKSIAITFDEAFTETPVVLATIEAEYIAGYVHGIYVYNISTSGFTATLTKIKINSSSTFVDGVVHWVALGK